jgi:hypothetical protein
MVGKTKSEFEHVYRRLRQIMCKYEGRGLRASPDKPGEYILIGPETETSRGREVWFGGAQIKKNYVSYHLMPVYAFPDLLEGIDPALKRRMQGKSCFNFKTVDEVLFKELARLTERGFRRFKQEKLIR